MTDFSAEFPNGKHDERKNDADGEGHPPIDVEHHGEKDDKSEAFLKKVGEIFGEGDASLLNVVDHRGQHAPRGVVLKKPDGLANDFRVDLVAQVGDGGMTGVLDFGYAKIFGYALGNEKHNEGEAENRPNVVNARG